MALLASAMTAGNAEAAGWPQPSSACTSANAWQTEDVYYYSRWQELQITYVCDPDAGWTLFQICDLKPGGICVVY
jgi:hypothetical protein